MSQNAIATQFADAGFNEFNTIMAKAKIPELPGVAGKVIQVLQQRIGNASLSIESVASDLNLSKRTLQRRLQQQMMNFASLRDVVRFNVSIKCLLELNMSIESTSNYLDFSDRTSFTNAFKRWTDLSPSTFRKLYRDYM